jgi:methyl-accepting chemotaxis protein
MIASIKQVSENTDALSTSAEQTSSSITEMSSSVKEVEQRAIESARLAEKVSLDASERGMTTAKEAISGMQNIKETVEATAAVVNRLGKRSHEIGQILKVIDDVTDQTSLLALNAAILASQAGEHGKGFAVVAEEIKDLAERTAASTQEIAGLIASVQEETAESVQAMGRGLKAVERGVDLVNMTSEVLEQVADSSQRSANMARAIEKTTAEQAKGVAQITETSLSISEQLEHIAGALQEQRKGSERIVQAAERMRDITQQVRSATQEQTTGSRSIANAVESVTAQAAQVARSTSEQSLGAQQISEAINRIQKITKETVDVSIELDMAVKTLKQKADALQSELKGFKF